MKNEMYLVGLSLVLCVTFSILGCNKSENPPRGPLGSGPASYSAPAPPTPTAEDYVLEAMQLLIEYHNVFLENINRTNNRLQNRPNDFSGVIQGFGDVRSLSEAQAIYIRNLQSINISHCPADFQARFNSYVQSEIKILNLVSGITHPDTNSENGLLGELFIGVISAGIGGQQGAEERDAARDALYNLAEEKYGVQIVSK